MNNSDRPAMPIAIDNGDGSINYMHGISKREHFAAMAMQGMLSCTDDGDCEMHSAGVFSGHLSRNAVEFADALLKALEESK